MVRAAFVGLLLGLCALGACSGKTVEEEGAGGDSGGTDKSPVNKPAKPAPVPACQTYASTWCTKAFGCYVQVGRLDEGSRQYNVDECKRLIIEKLPCSAATSVGGEFDTCLSQIKGMACSKWNVPQAQFATVVPPSSCDNAIGFDE
jgi:hypothetical protein